MKKAAALVLLSLFISPLGAQTEKRITIMHTNDLHSRLIGYAPELSYSPLTTNDDNTVGGFARIATIINDEKKRNEGITIVVDAGDFLMGTLFQNLEPATGFQLRLMKNMGYDAVCIGNHEFDFGQGKLAEILNSSSKGGAIPDVLLSNAVLDDMDPADDELGKLFSNGTINRKMIITRDGIKIGFFSLMGKVADENAAYAPPVTFAKQVPSAKKLVRELREEGCDLIICISHSGVSADKSGNWAGEDVELAQKVKGIDVIISGHTHSKIDKPIIVNGIPIVQAGEYGQNVGRLTISINNGVVAVEDYSLIPVDDRIKGDPVVSAQIDDQKKVVAKEILNPLGMEYDKPLAETDFNLECNEQGDVVGSNLGPMVADAIHNYVNKHVKNGTDVSMVAVGVIRDKIVPGLQTAPDIFRIMSMGNGGDNVPGYPLARLYVTGHEMKGILEILLLAGKSTPGYYFYYSGLKVDYNPEKGMLKKIYRIQIIQTDGTIANVDFSKKNKTLYSITANSYIIEFIGIIKKMSFGLINVEPKDAQGDKITDMKTAVMDFDDLHQGIQEGKEWLAIVEYLSAMKDINGNGVPDIDKKYKSAIQSFSPVKER